MAAAAPWSVKGIDPKAREVAKDLARRSGMTLGEWLNRVILEDDVPEEVTSEDHFGDRVRPLREQARPRIVGATPRLDELGRIATALDRLASRIESSETRTSLAISGVEQSVRAAVSRIEAAERDHVAVAARLEAGVGKLGTDQGELAGRLARMEAEPAGPRSAEALAALEQSLSRIAGRTDEAEARTADALARLDARVRQAETVAAADPGRLVEAVVERLGERLADAEGRTTAALDSLRGSLGDLDRRLSGFESGARADLDQRMQTLASQLGEKLTAARAEIAQHLQAAVAQDVDARLAAVDARVAAAERRSAQAVERMGREVLMLAEAMNRRLQSAEVRSAEAIEQVGGEVARIAGTIEARLSRTEQVHAEALGRLAGEIGRITERLTERMAISERRAADAIEDVGQQVARVTERMEQRHDRASGDLAERLRQSEARTASLLAGAGISRPEAGPAAPAKAAGPRAADAFVPIPEPDDLFDFDLPDPPGGGRPLSTREVIEQARAAARAAGEVPPQVQARADWRAPPRTPAAASRKRRTHNTTLQTAFMVAGGAAFLSVGAAGVALIEGPRPGPAEPAAVTSVEPPPRAAIALAPQTIGQTPGQTPEPGAPGPQASPTPQAPEPSRPITGAVLPPAAPAAVPKARGDYAAVTRALEAGEPGALARLKALAEAGDARSQSYLGKAHEAGLFGLVPSMGEARRWTERAAQGGDASAMHNLALYYFGGDGGSKDAAAAAVWFRRAADRGVVDSQYNLGLLYQSGSGVKRDLAEAYKWFTIAANGGDAQARSRAVEVEGKLSPEALAAAGKAATAFRSGATTVAQATARPASNLATAQRILGRLGYYKGASDGANSAAFQTAITAYQRDQGLPPSGALDPGTITRLSAFSR